MQYIIDLILRTRQCLQKPYGTKLNIVQLSGIRVYNTCTQTRLTVVLNKQLPIRELLIVNSTQHGVIEYHHQCVIHNNAYSSGFYFQNHKNLCYHSPINHTYHYGNTYLLLDNMNIISYPIYNLLSMDLILSALWSICVCKFICTIFGVIYFICLRCSWFFRDPNPIQNGKLVKRV